MLDLNLLNLRIKNESLPLPILYALKSGEKREEILAILKKGEVKGEEAEKLSALVSEAEGLDRLWELFRNFKVKAKARVKSKVFGAILEATVPGTPY
jgi:geranylgeranyl pyrophosphate synthase